MEQQKNMAKERNPAFDVMNILACISVVALHHNTLVHSYTPGAGWVQSLIVECFCYWCVPVFLMVSGANLVGYKERYSTGVFLKKRLLRTVIPWLFWSMVFLVWRIYLKEYEPADLTWRTVAYTILNNKDMTVYWFFSSLFMCYLAMPVLSSLRNNRRTLWYIVGINFLYHSCRPAVSNWLNLKWNIDAPLGVSLLLFVVLGYLLSTRPPKKKERIMLYILGGISVLFRFFYTWIRSEQLQSTDTSIKGYALFHSVFFACAVFVLLYRIPWNKVLSQWLKSRIPNISSCSLGIYLIHWMVMLLEKSWLGLENNMWTWRILCVPLTYVISLGIVALIRKIPGGRFLTGG